MSDTGYIKLIKKLEKNFFKYTILISILFFSIVIFTIYHIQTLKLDDYKQDISTKIETSFKFAEKNTINSLSITLKRLIHNKEIVELFHEKRRGKLYLKVEEEFDFIIQNNIYVKVMQFHNADGTSFLRMHKSSKHSDNIATRRPMLQEVHKKHKSLVGYESGAYATALRVIEPIFYNSEYIGALEIGVDPGFILNYIEKTIHEEGFF